MPLRLIASVERGGEIGGLLNRRGPAAVGAGEGGEIGVLEVGAANPLRIFALLVHADGAVASVVGDDHQQVGAVLRGGRQLLAVHQEVAVAGHADDRAVLEAERRSDRGGEAVAHRARGRRELGRLRAVTPVAVPPAREIAGAVADDGVRRELVAHRRDARAEVERDAFARLAARVHSSHSWCACSPAGEADQVGVGPVVDHLGELAHVGADRQIGVIDPAELVGVGVDVDQRLAGMVGGDQSVAVGGRFAEPRADGDDQVGVADALLQLGVGAVAELAGIDPAVVGDRVLAAEGGGGRDPVAEGEIGEMMPGARAPVGAADDRDRVRRPPSTARTAPGSRRDRAPRRAAGPRGRSGTSTSSRSMSSGSASTTGPGRPAVATRQARATYSGIRRASSIRAAHLAIGPKKAGKSISWKPSRSRSPRATSPMNRIIGVEILEGDMDPAAGVGRSGAAGDEGDARAAGHLAVGVGHVGDSAFLPADGEVDLGRVVERVEHGEEALAGNGEDAVAALDPELVDEDASACSGAGALGHPRASSRDVSTRHLRGGLRPIACAWQDAAEA